jgi:hypothetical protein
MTVSTCEAPYAYVYEDREHIAEPGAAVEL